jgi:competence protein ComGC
MDIIGQVLLFVVALLLSGLLLLAIPEFLGQKTGIWVAKTGSSQQDNLGKTKAKHFFLPVGELPWWGGFAVVIAVEVMITILVALDVPNIPPQRPFFPVYIYRALLTQQLQEPVYIMVYSILMITAIFVVSFARVLLVTRKKRTEG